MADTAQAAEADVTGGSQAAVPRIVAAVGSRGDHVFYLGMSAAILATVFVGFAPTYYLKGISHAAPLRPLIHLHGLVFTGWVLLFATQTTLAARHRLGVHRRLGWVGAPLGLALVALGLAAAIGQARRRFAAGDQGAVTFLAILFGDMFVFLALAAAGVLWRRRGEAHKRLMLLATISIMDAAIARWPFAMANSPNGFFALTDVFVLVCMARDMLTRREVHPAFFWGGLFVVVSQPLRVALAGTTAWITFARRLVE